jgi:hypothetical protein
MEYSSKKTETPIARVAHQQQLESTEHLATRRTTPTPYPMKNPRLRYWEHQILYKTPTVVDRDGRAAEYLERHVPLPTRVWSFLYNSMVMERSPWTKLSRILGRA